MTNQQPAISLSELYDDGNDSVFDYRWRCDRAATDTEKYMIHLTTAREYKNSSAHCIVTEVDHYFLAKCPERDFYYLAKRPNSVEYYASGKGRSIYTAAFDHKSDAATMMRHVMSHAADNIERGVAKIKESK